MHILFITTAFPPLVDGVGDYTYNLAQEFVNNGHQAIVVCKKKLGIKTDYANICVCPIIERWNLFAIQSVIRVIKEYHIDVVSLQYVPHGYQMKGLPFSLIVLLYVIRKCNVKIFTFCHELFVRKEKGNLKRNILSFLMRNITKCIILQSDFVATSIKVYQQQINGLIRYKKLVGLIPINSNVPEVSVDTDSLCSLRTKIAAKDEYIVSFWGFRKMNEILSVLLENCDNGLKIKLLSIGNSLKNIPTDRRIYKTGILPLHEIGSYLKISDVLILPEDRLSGCSFKSGTLLAALKNGVVVLTNKGQMTDDSLVDKFNIVFANFSDKKVFLKSLMWLINHPEERKKIGENAKQTVSHISWRGIYMSYMDWME